METQEFTNLRRRAIAFAARRGYPALGEDFAGFLFEEIAKGKIVQKLNWLFIDFLRKEVSGRMGHGTSLLKMKAYFYPEDISKLEESLIAPEVVSGAFEPREMLKGHLPKDLRTVLILYFKWGLTLDEIAHALGYSTSAISLKLAEALSKEIVV